MSSKVLFIDRDGTLIEEPADEQVDALDKVRLLPGVIDALIRLRAAGYRLVLVSNQDGLGTESFPTDDFERVQTFVRALFDSQGIEFEAEFFCPHFERDNCDCRKPRTGLLTAYLAASDIDLERSAVIGDRDTDLALARNLGVRGLRVEANGDPAHRWAVIARTLTQMSRRAVGQRDTRETRVSVSVDLDAEGPNAIDTGIGFFDHMLDQIASHGGFAMNLTCQGDLEIDEHHTVEDTALTLGDTLRRALGEKIGIGRFGFVLPMDETLAHVALDLGGRPYSVFEGTLVRERVGGLPTEMVPHFFRSLADGLRATLHIRVTGENTHHQVEAAFKGFGRALRQAIAVTGTALPSTKGTL